MKCWRWVLSLACFCALLGLLGSGFAGGDKDKDKTVEKDKAVKDKDTGKDKDKVADKDKDKVADKDKDKVADKDKDKVAGKDKDKVADKDKDKVADKDKDKVADKVAGKDKDKVADKDKDTGKDKKEEKTDYAWKGFEKEFFQKLHTVTTQKLTVMDQKIEQTQTQTFYVRWGKGEPDKDGNWLVEQEIQGMEMLIDIGGNKISYKSDDKDKASNPMSDFFKNLVGAKLKYKINGKLEITEIDNRKELIEKLSTTNPQMKTLLETLLSADALKQMAQPTWGAFPPATRKDNEWTVPVTLNLGNIGTYTSKINYSIDKADKNKINIASTLEYEAPKDVKAGPRLPFTIKKANEKKEMTATGKGTATWDPAAGRFSEVAMTTNIDKLTLVIEVGNVDTAVTINQTQVSTITTSDKKLK